MEVRHRKKGRKKDIIGSWDRR